MLSNAVIKSWRYTSLVLLLVCLFLSCRTAVNKEFTEFEKDLIKSDVKAMFDAYRKGIIEKGLTAEFDYLDTSSSFFWVPPGFNKHLSYAEVKTILLQNANTIKFLEMEWDTLRIEPITKTLATYTGILKNKTSDTTGGITSSSLIESGVVIKREDGWKLLSGQTGVLK